MEANTFIANLKANGSERDFNSGKCFNEFIEILNILTPTDRASFSLNVLCILCRNLEKLPAWRNKNDNKELLTLSIECLRHTRSLDKPEQAKTLACVFHIHKNVINKNSSSPAELVIKLSYMPFEYDDLSLLNEYYKTYGHIIIDRIMYIEKLKLSKISIIKLLPKLMEDVIKVAKIYDMVQFCTNMLTFLIKKVYYVYNEFPKDVNKSLGMIFDCISRNDLKKIKYLSEKEALELYVKLNECLYTITENSLKINFIDSVLDSVTRISISLLGHRSDMFHCFQTIYLNSFCCLFNDKSSQLLIENVLHSLLNSCEMTEKLGYNSVINATYPFLSQLLRLYIEHNVNNRNFENLTETLQESCLKSVMFLLGKLKTTSQLTKCENCNIKSGLHDALRLSFSVKSFITVSASQEIDLINILPVYFTVVEQQYVLLESLKQLRCANGERCFKKQQTDIHNIAVLLNKHKYYEYSIKLFEIYLNNELKNIKNDTELKNASRALYNKSICELDCMLYLKSLLNAYLSLIFSLPDGLNTEKYMSLVIDIKSKALKSIMNEEQSGQCNDLQSISILSSCTLLYSDSSYGNLKMYFKNLKFSSLLKHEFSMYVKLWPSIVPIAGVWKSLYDLSMDKNSWLEAEDKETVLQTLFEVVLETPTVVRNIHDDCYRTIVLELVQHFENASEISDRDKLVHGALLLLQSEYDISEAAQRHQWKVTEHTADPDQDQTMRTIKQEHEAISSAVKAVDVFTEAVRELESDTLSKATLGHIAQILCVSVQQLMLFELVAHGLQLAQIACRIADVTGDRLSYISNASVLIYHSDKKAAVDPTVRRAVKYAAEFIRNGQNLDAALCLVCDVALYYIKCESLSAAQKFIQFVQAKVLSAYENKPNINLDLSLGRLMEAQAMLCPGSGLSTLSAINGVHRHYLTVRNAGVRWAARRLVSLRVKNSISLGGARAVRLARRLSLWRRAAAAAAAALAAAGAARRALIFADTTNAHCGDNATVKIDNRLRHILDLTPPADSLQNDITIYKQEQVAPKLDNLETMLDCVTEKHHISPIRQCLPLPVYRTPDFLEHANSCTCYACSLPACAVIACQIAHLEASMYYRAQQYRIAKNYFDGALKCFELAETKFKTIFDNYKTRNFHDTPIEIGKNRIENEFRTVKLEFLVELTYFELHRNEFAKSDDHLVTIHEMLSEMNLVDPYLRNEVANLMVASARLRKPKHLKLTGLEVDMEELKLSPNALQKTPESRTMPKINTVKLVKTEELPKKIKPIKWNLDADNTDEQESKIADTQGKLLKDKRAKFKVPVPVTSKPVIENLTPIPTRSKPRVILTQPTMESSNFDIHQEGVTNNDDSETENANKKHFNTKKIKIPPNGGTKSVSENGTSRITRSKPNVLLTQRSVDLSDSDLDLDDKADEEMTTAKSKKSEFKVPAVNGNLKSAFENRTPKPSHSSETKHDICTPKSESNAEFFTPCQSTTAEQFFTPMSSLKTYSKRGVVKNLDSEFSTSKTDENSDQIKIRDSRSKTETGSIKSLREKRSFKRATSPGKLVEEIRPVARIRRQKPSASADAK